MDDLDYGEIARHTAELMKRIRTLEQENERLKAELLNGREIIRIAKEQRNELKAAQERLAKAEGLLRDTQEIAPDGAAYESLKAIDAYFAEKEKQEL